MYCILFNKQGAKVQKSIFAPQKTTKKMKTAKKTSVYNLLTSDHKKTLKSALTNCPLTINDLIKDLKATEYITKLPVGAWWDLQRFLNINETDLVNFFNSVM